MPAAAVIPAPIGYIKVVAVEKLVVEVIRAGRGNLTRPKFGDKRSGWPLLVGQIAPPSLRAKWSAQSRLLALNISAWNDKV